MVLVVGRNDASASGSISISGLMDLTNTKSLHLRTGADVASQPAGRLVVEQLAIEAGTGITLGAVGGGSIVITQVGPLTISQNVLNQTGGPITLEARENPAGVAPADMRIASGVFVSAATDVTLRAGDDLTIEASAVVEGLDAIRIYGDYGNTDSHGTVIAIHGRLVGGEHVEINGEQDDDVFILAGPASAPVVLRGGKGDDRYQFHAGATGSQYTLFERHEAQLVRHAVRYHVELEQTLRCFVGADRPFGIFGPVRRQNAKQR